MCSIHSTLQHKEVARQYILRFKQSNIFQNGYINTQPTQALVVNPLQLGLWLLQNIVFTLRTPDVVHNF